MLIFTGGAGGGGAGEPVCEEERTTRVRNSGSSGNSQQLKTHQGKLRFTSYASDTSLSQQMAHCQINLKSNRCTQQSSKQQQASTEELEWCGAAVDDECCCAAAVEEEETGAQLEVLPNQLTGQLAPEVVETQISVEKGEQREERRRNCANL